MLSKVLKRIRNPSEISGYWSSMRESWPRMVPERSTVSNLFGSRANKRFRYDLTLLEATERNNDRENAFAMLVKESSATLLLYARKGYPYSAWEFKLWSLKMLQSFRPKSSIRPMRLVIS
ncbi:hypothetical protein LguiB_020315 [Lonicera macranthoides]